MTVCFSKVMQDRINEIAQMYEQGLLPIDFEEFRAYNTLDVLQVNPVYGTEPENAINAIYGTEPRYVAEVDMALGHAWKATFEVISLMQDLTHRGIQFDEYPLDIDIAGDWGLSVSQMFEGFPTSSSYDFAGVPEPEPQPAGPALPFEVFHTQEFNESAAWEAVVALSRGM